MRIFSRQYKQMTFSDAGFLGILRVKIYMGFVSSIWTEQLAQSIIDPNIFGWILHSMTRLIDAVLSWHVMFTCALRQVLSWLKLWLVCASSMLNLWYLPYASMLLTCAVARNPNNIDEILAYLVSYHNNCSEAWANSVDPDQMLHDAASDLGLHGLQLIQQFLDTSMPAWHDLNSVDCAVKFQIRHINR